MRNHIPGGRSGLPIISEAGQSPCLLIPCCLSHNDKKKKPELEKEQYCGAEKNKGEEVRRMEKRERERGREWLKKMKGNQEE
jgi:hypothetical protein